MPDTSPPKSQRRINKSPLGATQRHTEACIKVYMSSDMRDELFERSDAAPGEGTNVSRIVRGFIREGFRRHPFKSAKK